MHKIIITLIIVLTESLILIKINSLNRLDRFYNPHHEAVLRMIEMTIKGAHKHGKWVGICGELGADTTLTERFIKMGIDELSVSPSMVLGVRSRICEME